MPEPTQQGYSQDNPFAPKGQTAGYSPDNPFAKKKYTPKHKPFVDAEPEGPNYLQQAAGGVASLLRSVPGGEAAQSGARAVVRGGGWKDLLKDGLSPTGLATGVARVAGSPAYREAREEIRDAEDTASPFVRNFNSLAGGVVSGAAITGSPVLQGARYGIASGLGNSDQDATVKGRLHSAAAQGSLGAVGGAVIPGAVKGLVRNGGTIRDVALSFVPGLSGGARGRLANKGTDALARVLNHVRQRADALRTPGGTSAVDTKPPSVVDVIKRRRSARSVAGEIRPPQAEGLQSPMASVADAIESQRSAPQSAAIEKVRQALQRQGHRTQASFDDFARRMGKEPQQTARRTGAPPAAEPAQGLPPAENDLLNELLTRARREQASMAGSKVGDADIAQGFDAPEQDLADQLRRSLLTIRGGKLR